MLNPKIVKVFAIILQVIVAIHTVLVSIILPSSPEFEVQSMNAITTFSLVHNPLTNTTLSFAFGATLWIGNPNEGTLYKQPVVSLFYQHHLLLTSLSSVHSFYNPDSTSSIWLPLTVAAASVPVSDHSIASALATDINNGQLNHLSLKLTADYRWFRYYPTHLVVTCKPISVALPSGIMLGAPAPCNVYWEITVMKSYVMLCNCLLSTLALYLNHCISLISWKH